LQRKVHGLMMMNCIKMCTFRKIILFLKIEFKNHIKKAI